MAAEASAAVVLVDVGVVLEVARTLAVAPMVSPLPELIVTRSRPSREMSMTSAERQRSSWFFIW